MRERMGTGLDGLDTVLDGGFVKNSTVLLEGMPGSGKTTMGLQFLQTGSRPGDAGVYITFEELPQQIYQDAAELGWDLKALEAEGRLRIVSTSPEALMAELLEPAGWIDELVQTMGVNRLVIDSVTVLSSKAAPDSARALVFTMQSALKRLGLTSLLIRELAEPDGPVAADAYLADTWIRLGWMANRHQSRPLIGVRTLEVLKHRGSDFLAGEHVLRITDQGLRLYPAGILPPHVMWREHDLATISTGLPELDHALGGGLIAGATYLFDTNSRTNYAVLLQAIQAEHLRRGGAVLALLSSAVSFSKLADHLSGFGLDALELARQGRFLAVDGYRRHVPNEFAPFVLPHHDRESIAKTHQRLQELMLSDHERWMLFYDMNTVISTMGFDYIRETFAQQVSGTRDHGIPFVTTCNFAEVPPELASYLERSVNGVIHTWQDRRYQYLQVTKSPSGKTTDPLLVLPTAEPPFVVLR